MGWYDWSRRLWLHLGSISRLSKQTFPFPKKGLCCVTTTIGMKKGSAVAFSLPRLWRWHWYWYKYNFSPCQMLPICPDHPCDSNSAECETCRWVSQLHQCPQFSLSICLLLVWQHHGCDTLCVYLLPLENTQGLSGWILWQWPLSHRSPQLSCQKGTGS